ncbi:integrase-type DNA-binding superfamily protein [Striga asiatica]|uniref:Integrase-type DNA-binding superfamily protein n=1 Tax=Striga asiatica TaxID=4170 RepID=A0A5A7Q251_STRAF|nr:integrase-type DNA-binding superfamily protein [Striga asiatica]
MMKASCEVQANLEDRGQSKRTGKDAIGEKGCWNSNETGYTHGSRDVRTLRPSAGGSRSLTPQDLVMVERVGYCLFVSIAFERMPEFSSQCNILGHSAATCWKHVPQRFESLMEWRTLGLLNPYYRGVRRSGAKKWCKRKSPVRQESLDARPGTVRKVMGIAKPGTLSQYPELVDSLAHEGHNRIAALDLEGTAAVHCFREKALETSLSRKGGFQGQLQSLISGAMPNLFPRGNGSIACRPSV